MAKFCNDSCHAICDFCKYYRDEIRDIQGIKDEFAGEGICSIDGKLVDASDGYKCGNFECFRLEFIH